MRDYPDGADLLVTARDVLRNQLLGVLPPEMRTAALMVANAMAIAARQLETCDDPQRVELASLRALFETPCADVPDAGVLRRELETLNRRLVLALRSGDADPATPLGKRALAHLRSVQRARVMQSNPRYLDLAKAAVPDGGHRSK
jgi:hypothetical protein